MGKEGQGFARQSAVRAHFPDERIRRGGLAVVAISASFLAGTGQRHYGENGQAAGESLRGGSTFLTSSTDGGADSHRHDGVRATSPRRRDGSEHQENDESTRFVNVELVYPEMDSQQLAECGGDPCDARRWNHHIVSKGIGISAAVIMLVACVHSCIGACPPVDNMQNLAMLEIAQLQYVMVKA